MKTIIVVYTDTKLSKVEIGMKKKYSFNTESSVKEGDLLNSSSYDTKMQVVKVLDSSFKYLNRATGELSNEFTSTQQWEIRTMIIQDEDEPETVYASRIIQE